MTALRILLIEDDANISAVLAETLEGLGHSICAIAATENAAVAAASRCKPDLMIVDIGLAAGNGVAAVARILLTGHVPHVFMSGIRPAHRTDGMPVLRKPFRTADLVLSIEAALEQPGPAVGATCDGPATPTTA